MLNKFKKATAILLAGALAAGMASCSGGGSKETENVTLKWVMSGPGELADSQKVWAEFNNRLQEFMPGTTVQFEVYPGGDYNQKFMLMQTVGDKVDIANVYKLNYGDELRKGTFADITELVDTYGQDMKAAIPEFIWDYMRYEGKLYAVPTYQQVSVSNAFFFPKAISDKYLDKKALEDAIVNNDTINDNVLDVLEDYLAKCKEAGEIGYGMDHWLDITGKGFNRIVDYYAVRRNDPEHKVELLFQTPEIKSYYARKAEWYKKGYIRQDSLSSQDDQKGKEGGNVLWQATSGYKPAETASVKYGMEIDCVDFDVLKKYPAPMSYSAMGNAVMAASENKEKAIELLNLINTEKGKDLYNLLVYGIEGDHYTKVGENKIQTEYNGQVSSSDRYGLYKWIVGNTQNAYDNQGDLEGYKNWVFNEVNKTTNFSDLAGFIPDTTKISTQLAQVLAVKGEYFASLMSGALPNEAEIYDEFMKKLDEAGNQQIIDELQRQVDEFIASKNN